MSDNDEAVVGCLFLIGFVVFLLFIFIIPLNIKMSRDAEHNGYITSVTQGYNPFNSDYKVWVKTNFESSQEDMYCIKSENIELIEKVREFAKKRQLVNVVSDEVVLTGFWNCDGWIIKDIQILEVAK